MIVTRRATAGFGGFGCRASAARGFGDCPELSTVGRYFGCDDDLNEWDDGDGDGLLPHTASEYRAKYGIALPARVEGLLCQEQPCGMSQLREFVAKYPPQPGDYPSASGLTAETGGEETPPDAGTGGLSPGVQLPAQPQPLPSWVWPGVAGVGGIVVLGVLASVLRR